MKNRKGFTLLELLIAATIVAALAVMATVAYRNGVIETRIQAAKTRTEVLAGAVQRFVLDYGASKLGAGPELQRLAAKGACAPNGMIVSSLINCDYVDNDGGWNDPYFAYYVCNGVKTAGTPCSKTTLNAPLACMWGRSNQNKLPAKYKTNYSYCVSATGNEEKFGS